MSDDAITQVKDLIDEVTDDSEMSKAEYKEFLEELKTEVDTRLEAVTQELEAEADAG